MIYWKERGADTWSPFKSFKGTIIGSKVSENNNSISIEVSDNCEYLVCCFSITSTNKSMYCELSSIYTDTNIELLEKINYISDIHRVGNITIYKVKSSKQNEILTAKQINGYNENYTNCIGILIIA